MSREAGTHSGYALKANGEPTTANAKSSTSADEHDATANAHAGIHATSEPRSIPVQLSKSSAAASYASISSTTSATTIATPTTSVYELRYAQRSDAHAASTANAPEYVSTSGSYRPSRRVFHTRGKGTDQPPGAEIGAKHPEGSVR